MPIHELGHVIKLHPEQAKKRILKALRDTGVHKGDTSKLLGCSHNCLLNWIKQLDLDLEVEELKEKAIDEGWYHGKVGGMPLGTIRTDEDKATRRKEVRIAKLIEEDPKEAAKKVLDTIRKAKGNLSRVPRCNEVVVKRWVKALGLQAKVQQIQAKFQSEAR